MGRWRAPLAVIAALVVLAAAGVAVTHLGRRGASSAAAETPASTATVVRTDLAQTTPVNGTVGFANPVSIVEPGGTPSTALTQAQQAASSAAVNVAADEAAVNDTNAGNGLQAEQSQQALAAAQATGATDGALLRSDTGALDAAQAKEAADCQGDEAAGATPSSAGGAAPSSSGGTCATDASTVAADAQKVTADQQKVTGDQAAVQNAQDAVAMDQQKAVQGTDQVRAKLSADQAALANAQAALATADGSATSYQATSRYTALPAVGQEVQPGQALWSVDGAAVALLQAPMTAWRSFAPGMADGPDVAALDAALIAVGDGVYGLTPSDTFTTATAAAIRRFQAALGEPQTGVLPLGSVVFEPSAVRVTAVHPIVGAPVQGGAPVVDVTSTTPQVNVALPVDQTYLVKAGDVVTVNLPDGSNAKGTVTAVGTVATTTTPSSGNGSGSPSATVNVTVSLTNAPASARLDQAPVTVEITNGAAQGVLAVPVGALLALAGGGYAVEVVQPDGTHHLAGVTTGIFDDQAGLVQVSGNGLAAGQTVVTAS
jgi:multidrug efflux pump subunit AcrA (membrane-fusion protein)